MRSALPLLALVLVACSPTPAARPALATERLPPPAEPGTKKVRLHVGESTLVAFAVDATADDPSLFRLLLQDQGVAIVARKVGKSALTVREKEGHPEKLEIEVIPGAAVRRALVVGETITFSMQGVREYSVGLPDVVSAVATTSGSDLLVTGRRDGLTTLLLLKKSGEKESHEIVVVGGRRLD